MSNGALDILKYLSLGLMGLWILALLIAAIVYGMRSTFRQQTRVRHHGRNGPLSG